MKLFTAICTDARLLGCFLEHYHNYGVTEFFLAVTPGLKPAVISFADRYGITIHDDLDVADSIVGGTTAVSEMRRRYQGHAEWAIIVDLDEFVEFSPGVHAIVHWAELEQANVVRGVMWDRFARDGRVVGFQPDADLFQVYPIRARFIRNVMQGADWKGVLVKGLLEPVAAHHAFENEIVCTRELELSHYKWFDGAIDRLRAAYQMVVASAQPWAVEYERILNHYEQLGRFAWEQFGGEEAPDYRIAASGGTPRPRLKLARNHLAHARNPDGPREPQDALPPCDFSSPRSEDAFGTAILDHWNSIAPILADLDKNVVERRKSRNIAPASHPHDLSAEDAKIAIASTDRPDLLRDLMQTSRSGFGFYTCHFPFTINHTWAAKRLEAVYAGARVLDIGSGLSPLPLFLARRGLLVDCVDNSELVRIPPPQPDWHEWGFFDYGTLHPNLSSYHCDILDFEPRRKYQTIYALCVLAHMTAAERNGVLDRCRSWLEPGGTLLLTFDIVRGTEFVWNFRLGSEFEPRSTHGTTATLVGEIESRGFQVIERIVLRDVYNARSDLFLLACTI